MNSRSTLRIIADGPSWEEFEIIIFTSWFTSYTPQITIFKHLVAATDSFTTDRVESHLELQQGVKRNYIQTLNSGISLTVMHLRCHWHALTQEGR